jgi:hypothetical protein
MKSKVARAEKLDLESLKDKNKKEGCFENNILGVEKAAQDDMREGL